MTRIEREWGTLTLLVYVADLLIRMSEDIASSTIQESRKLLVNNRNFIVEKMKRHIEEE